jgi:cellulose synthase/poly-beta-1,6-N-acetylglucosamine synthase-like glycosyltransferase
MEIALSIFVFFLLLCYSAVIVWLSQGLRKLDNHNKNHISKRQDVPLPKVSVIVAARNEARNLPRLIHCLRMQEYPAEKIEFYIVDDRSGDESWQILNRAGKRFPNLNILQIKDTLPDYAPKKRALDRAIRASRGEILLLTDADCTPPPTWVRSMVNQYDEKTVMVPGYSPYRFDFSVPKIVKGLLALDYFSLAAVAAGAIGRGFPLTAAGCNLSYRRETYFEAGGFEPIRRWISGDDDLFLLSVARQKPGRMIYALAPASFVPCAAPSSLKQFWHQRIRYASKGLHYSLPVTAGLLAVYVLNVMLALAIPAFFAGYTSFALGGFFVWVIKSVLEYFFLKQGAAIFSEKKLLRYFFPTTIIHPFYITVFAFLGACSRFEWKDTKAAKIKTAESIAYD